MDTFVSDSSPIASAIESGDLFEGNQLNSPLPKGLKPFNHLIAVVKIASSYMKRRHIRDSRLVPRTSYGCILRGMNVQLSGLSGNGWPLVIAARISSGIDSRTCASIGCEELTT